MKDMASFYLLQKRINVGMEEYRQDLIAYAIWKDDWRKRQAATREQGREGER